MLTDAAVLEVSGGHELAVGDRVEDTVYLRGMTGTVVELIKANPENPAVEHGSITVRLDPEHIGKFSCSPPDEEHYTEHGWQNFLRLLP